MTVNLEGLARQLVRYLDRNGVPADVAEPDPGAPWAERVNVWAPAAAVTDDNPTINRYPQASVVICENAMYSDYSWGGNYEHQLPLDTPIADVGAAVIRTLPQEVRAVLPHGPERWVRDAIAEQEAYLASRHADGNPEVPC
jgi:hypothetical protein